MQAHTKKNLKASSVSRFKLRFRKAIAVLVYFSLPGVGMINSFFEIVNMISQMLSWQGQVLKLKMKTTNRSDVKGPQKTKKLSLILRNVSFLSTKEQTPIIALTSYSNLANSSIPKIGHFRWNKVFADRPHAHPHVQRRE